MITAATDQASATPTATQAAVTLRASNIVKRFPGVIALKNVTFEACEGEVHALVGENGAGKSTLMGVVSGDLTPDEGTLEIAGTGSRHSIPSSPATPASPWSISARRCCPT